MSALAETGIHLPDERPGKRRMPCPECDKGKADDALEVTVTPRRWAFWKCYRCGLEGKAPLDEAERGGRSDLQPRDDITKSGRGTSADYLAARIKRDRPDGLSPWAVSLWDACRPITAGSIAAYYLAVRGCALPENDVRWHPELRHPSGHVGPGMVARVTDVITAEPINLHKTWLAPDGSGKAAIDKPRLLLKGHRARGGCVRLWPDDEVTYGLCVAEGIETALTAAHAFTPVWALIDAGNLGAFPVLPGIEALTILSDHDRPNPRTGARAGGEAAEACAARWLEAGAEVRVWKALAEGADFNDFAMGAAA